MRNCNLVGLACGFLLGVCCAWGETMAVAKGDQDAYVLEKKITKTIGCKYLLYLPESYGEKQQAWPLMMFLHGAGERGDNLDLVTKHGPPKLVGQGKDFPFIIVSPQCPEGIWWPEKVATLVALLDDIESRYAVDTDRVYLTGLSMGGFGTWSLACQHPERFAAVAPICGGWMWFLGNRLQEVPVWAFHGARDNVVPLKASKEMVEAVQKAGGNAKLTVYPEAGHDSWTATYNNPALYEWLLSHSNRKKGK